MNLKEKLIKLNELYNLHDKLMKKHDFVCEKTCASCCTVNETITTLEGHAVIKELDSLKISGEIIQQRLDETSRKERLVPKVTINHFAQICIEDGDVPEEENDPAWGVCPLLENNLCMVYEARPLGCRALVSNRRCDSLGYADMPPIVLTINNLFSQIVEHLDSGGLYGNLTDVILGLKSIGGKADCASAGDAKKTIKLIPNRLMPAMMIPPEDRAAIGPILKQLSDIVPEIISV